MDSASIQKLAAPRTMREGGGNQRAKRAITKGRGTGWESIPDAVAAVIFSCLSAEDILRSCALVCKSWRSLTWDQSLWSQLCKGSGLRNDDARKYFGGWRALYIAVFGTNLIASPHFERIHHIDANFMKTRPLMLWEAKHRLLCDRICSDNEVTHEDYRYFSHWATEGGCLFQRGGGEGIIREQPPSGLPPWPGAPDKPVIATSREWGKVSQYVGLQAFAKTFLDTSPPVMLSVWYGGRQGTDGMFRVQMHLRDDQKATLFAWDSGELKVDGPHWKEVKRLVRGYPPGVRSIIVKIGGKSVIPKIGFHGAKFTAARLTFVALSEVRNLEHFEKLGSTWVMQPGDQELVTTVANMPV